MKTFNGDFDFFYNKLKNNEPFAISRNNDGEMIILNNEYINLLEKCNGEFIYDPKNEAHAEFRQKLLNSAMHKGDNYYVGIACRCCVGDQKHETLKKMTGQDDDHLTWGNIFVNANYPKFASLIVPIFSQRDIYIVANKKATLTKLPFYKNIKYQFRVGTNAWMDDVWLEDKIVSFVKERKIKGGVFLFAAGPYSNILIHKLYMAEPNNTYLDVGSTLDAVMDLGLTRGYLAGAPTLTQVCVW